MLHYYTLLSLHSFKERPSTVDWLRYQTSIIWLKDVHAEVVFATQKYDLWKLLLLLLSSHFYFAFFTFIFILIFISILIFTYNFTNNALRNMLLMAAISVLLLNRSTARNITFNHQSFLLLNLFNNHNLFHYSAFRWKKISWAALWRTKNKEQ